jgi:hypothetical protein
VRTVLSLMIAFFVLSSTVSAQNVQDACVVIPPGTVFTVTSGAPFTLMWIMPATGPASATDPTPVPMRIDGFYLAIDTGNRMSISAMQGSPCPAGTPNAGKIPYMHRTTSGVARGSHEARLTAWNYIVDSNGNSTGVPQDGETTIVPFGAVDAVMQGPPPAPTNTSIRR